MNHAGRIDFLLQKYSKGLVRYTAGILKDIEAAKEIVQEAFLKLLQSKDVANENVQAWLFRECRCRAIDQWRKNRRVSHFNEDEMGFSPSNPLHDLETQRDLVVMNQAIARLSPRHREALFLKYKDGLSYKEIAEVMELTATNVGFILHEAMTALREAADVPESKRKYGE